METKRGTKRKTTEEFIENAIKTHGDLYDYQYVKYIDSKTKITIVCSKHGKFDQDPSSHLKGHGCSKCKRVKRGTVEEFIEKSIKIHGDKYDYSKVVYIARRYKVIIICKIHGEFEQIASNHLIGYGCSECRIYKRKSPEKFIEDAREIHGDLYDYSKVVYINTKSKIKIICKKHGEFDQSPYAHLRSQGCPGCSGRRCKTTEDFIEDARKVHGDKYNYDLVNHINSNIKVIITCRIHGNFEQMPYTHLQGSGCSSCAKANYSQKSIKWLKEMETKYKTNIQHAENGGEMKIDLIRWGLKSDIYQSHFLLDGFDSMNLVCYEFNGCLWHGHSCMGNSNDINPINGKTFRELYEKTMEKERLIKLAGFKLISIWECEYKK